MLKKTFIENEEDIIFDKQQLFEIFHSGYKDCSQCFVGLEYEKLPINNETFKVPSYDEIKLFLEEFKSTKWMGLYENNSLLGLKNRDGAITLEPGCQTEISLVPKSQISDLDKYLKKYNSVTAQISEKFNITWLGCGIQPISTYENINIIPKKRYHYMTEYLPNVAKRPFVMMRGPLPCSPSLAQHTHTLLSTCGALFLCWKRK